MEAVLIAVSSQLGGRSTIPMVFSRRCCMMLFLQFLFAFASTVGFSIIFNIPRRHIFTAAFGGGCGWLTYRYLLSTGETMVIACFIGACVVALLSEIFCRIFKEASTVFVIPGILPLVPGAGMYNTMLSLLNQIRSHSKLAHKLY